jgi:hypothetical protein
MFFLFLESSTSLNEEGLKERIRQMEQELQEKDSTIQELRKSQDK